MDCLSSSLSMDFTSGSSLSMDFNLGSLNIISLLKIYYKTKDLNPETVFK